MPDFLPHTAKGRPHTEKLLTAVFSCGIIILQGGINVKCSIVIDVARDEEVIVYAHERNGLCDEIEQICRERITVINAGCDTEIHRIDVNEVSLFLAENGKTVAVTDEGRFTVKDRLYRLEEALPTKFVRINQSAIANIDRIARFDTSIAGTLKVIFKNGCTDYVSRRSLKKVKERLGL